MKQNKFVENYHDLLRPEILSRVPLTAERILDLGCGTGRLGAALKQRQVCTVNGVENDLGAVQEAEKNLDNVYNHNLDAPRLPKYGRKYDCIIFADILEHLINPWGVFLQEAEHLNDNGTIIVSLPNISHPSMIREVMLGLFRYQPAGILDVTHLRFFTKTTFSRFIAAQNFKIQNITPHPSKDNETQFIYTIKKLTPQKEKPLVTLLMPVFNNFAYTKLALDSIFANTTVPFKLVVVDNNSTDETAETLRKDDRILLIENSVNVGFPTAVNIATACVDTPYFAILNNDIIVKKNWLSHMIDTMNKDPKFAIIGPRSNYVSGPQVLKNVQYITPEDLDNFTAERMQECKKSPTEFHRIVFFCTLLKTELLSKIGTLDEIFGMGNFEDDDYCRRAIEAGYKCAIDHQVFIHHFGSTTFKSAGIDYKETMGKNQQIYEEKWKGK